MSVGRSKIQAVARPPIKSPEESPAKNTGRVLNKNKLCILGRGTDGLVHSKPEGETEIPEYIASASFNDVAKKKKISEISDHGAAHVVFADHVTALSVQFTTINLNRSPNNVILYSGCTRAMGSRYAIERLQRYVEDHCPGKITFTFFPSGTKFSFASSQSALITERVTLWFDTQPPANTTIEVLDEGSVPILFSIQQMRNLRMTLEHTPTADYATCEAFGVNRTVLPVSTNNHLVLDFLCFTRGPTCNMRDEVQTSFRATTLEENHEDSQLSEEALAGKGRPSKAKITCRNCLGNPKVAHSWHKHRRLFLPGKTVQEMRSKLEKDKAAHRKAPKAKAKADPSKPPPKAKVLAKKPVSGDAVPKKSASGSCPEPLESKEQAEAESGLVTYGGVTPLELAFGRRPRDIVTPENSDPAQLTGEPTDVEATAQAVKELAMRACSAARQALDLRRDLAARLNMSEGPFSIGENVYYWNSATNTKAQGDLSKHKTADGKRT